MKKLKLFSILLMLFFMLGIVVQCSEDDPVPLSSITGTVTYPNGAGTQVAAEGAVVTLFSTTPVVNMQTTTDANGKYTFSQLGAATYTLSAYYDTDNKNATARLDNLRFTVAATDVEVTSQSVTQDLALVSSGQTGIQAIDINFGWNNGTSSYVNSGTWAYDRTHSPLSFEFPYRNNVAEFGGAFSQLASINVNFDPANLSTSTITTSVDLASIDTRSSGGRDPLLDNMNMGGASAATFNPNSIFTQLGCIMGTFGITASGTLPTTITDTDRYATFTSTSIIAYGDGYLAKGNIAFNAVTKPAEIWFKAMTPYVSGTTTYSGFEGRFYMGKADFNISSGSVADIIRMQISIVAAK